MGEARKEDQVRFSCGYAYTVYSQTVRFVTHPVGHNEVKLQPVLKCTEIHTDGGMCMSSLCECIQRVHMIVNGIHAKEEWERTN